MTNEFATFKWGYAFRDEDGTMRYVLKDDASPELASRYANMPLYLDSRLFD